MGTQDESFKRMITVWITNETVQKAQEIAWKQHRTRTRVLSELLEAQVGLLFEQVMHETPKEERPSEKTKR